VKEEFNMKCHFLILSILVSLVAASAQAGPENVNWPGDYKRTLTHYFSGDRTANEKQIIRIYANDAAIAGVQADGKLPFGSVLVAELYAVQLDEKEQPVISSLGRRIAKNLAAIVVMQRGQGFDAGYPDHLTTGDWEFAVFNPAGQKLDKDVTGCRACHHPLVDKEFVFSYEHLR
jgi:hypothetical protein